MGEETLKRLLSAEATTSKLAVSAEGGLGVSKVKVTPGRASTPDSQPVMSREMREEYERTIALGLMFPPEE